MKTQNIIVAIIAIIVAVLFSVSMNAQSLTQQEVDSLNILNMRAVQASISDHANKDFAWASNGKRDDNKIVVSNRRGVLLGAEAGFNFNHGYEAGLKIGYNGAGLRCFAPEASLFVGNANVDDLSYTTYGVQLRGNFEFGSELIKGFAGPTCGYKYFTVDTGVQFDGEMRNHNQHSNAFTVGVNAGIKIKIGSITQKVSVPLYDANGNKRPVKAYSIKNPIYVTVAGSYNTYQVEKPGQVLVNVQEIGVKAGITFLF